MTNPTQPTAEATSRAEFEATPLPCPFCGGTSIDRTDGFTAICNDCLAEGPVPLVERGPALAVAAWNRRTPADDARDAARYRKLREGDDESVIDSIYPFSTWENTHWLKRGKTLDAARAASTIAQEAPSKAP